MNDAVGALQQTLRNNSVTRSGRPKIPDHWTFRFFPESHEISIDYAEATQRPYSQVPPGDWSIPENQGTRHPEALPSGVEEIDAPAQLYSSSSERQESWPAPINNNRSDIDDEIESELQRAIQDEFMCYLPKRNDASLVAESWPNSGEEDYCVEGKLDSRPVDMMQLDDDKSELGMPQARRQTKNKQPLTPWRMFLEEFQAHGRKEVPREVWDYVDWQMWNLDVDPMGSFHWRYNVLGKNMHNISVLEYINRSVSDQEQRLRTQASTRPPCPGLPRAWAVRFIMPIRKIFIFYLTPSSIIDAVVDELYMPTPFTPATNAGWMTSDTEDSDQEYESPTASRATSAEVPMNLETMAAPVLCAVSVNGELSWNPKNELFQNRQPQSYECMKGSPMSIRQSSVKSTRLSAMEMLSSSMRSIKP
ncbi:hypothetical protein KCU67_g9429, partial [Aureobasidium melanogenum]